MINWNPFATKTKLLPSPSFDFAASHREIVRMMMAMMDPQPTYKADDEEFEMNLTEALVGWKTWVFREGGLRSAVYDSRLWTPLAPFDAECKKKNWIVTTGTSQEEPLHAECAPRQHCTCGIYATDSREELKQYDEKDRFVGLIHGWGRYVRGEKGWRAQHAYPKAFYLKRHQFDLVEYLRPFAVPIFIDQPMRIYNPEEDGYHGHRHNETDWNFGAVADSDSTED